MNKNQKQIFKRIIGLFLYHPWLKLFALLLAVIVWFYVIGEGI